MNVIKNKNEYSRAHTKFWQVFMKLNDTKTILLYLYIFTLQVKRREFKFSPQGWLQEQWQCWIELACREWQVTFSTLKGKLKSQGEKQIPTCCNQTGSEKWIPPALPFFRGPRRKANHKWQTSNYCCDQKLSERKVGRKRGNATGRETIFRETRHTWIMKDTYHLSSARSRLYQIPLLIWR